MTDETKLQKALERQAHAKAILDSPIFQEAFTKLDETYVEAWRSAVDPAAREQLWLAQSNLRKVKSHLSRALSDGNLAQVEIADFEKRKRFGII